MIESQLKGQLESATQEAEQYKVKNYVNFTLVKDLSNSCGGFVEHPKGPGINNIIFLD